MKERDFQAKLIEKIKATFPGALVLKNDACYIQGIPDLLILYGDKWAALECKDSEHASRQPNQVYYVNLMNKMSYAGFVYPENVVEVIRNLHDVFRFW